jgi:uncharacterized membrane protein YgcG
MENTVMKKILLIAAVIFVFLFPAFARAQGDYKINTFDVNIVVNENNTYDVTENITAEFFVNKHGLERLIPQKVTAVRDINGQTETKNYRIIVSNIAADTQVSANTSGGYYNIRLGNPDVTVTGIQKYTLRYTYDPGDDGYSSFDEFYYNIIGTEWDVPIDYVAFQIFMPKSFDPSKIGFSLGSAGASGYNTDDIQYLTSDNDTKIIGSVHRALSPNEGLTIRLELPNGYYVGARQATGPANSLLIVSLVLLGIALLLAAFFLRKKKPVQTVEFYPPEGMTSADVGYVIDGIVEDKDVVSLIIYWADKGYLEIHQTEGSKDMTFIKKKELPSSANDYETNMFDSMFEGREKTSISALKYKFYDTVSATKEMVRFKYQRKDNLAFTKKSVAMQNLMAFLASVPLAAMTFINVYEQTFDVIFTAIVGLIVLAISWALISVYIKSIETWFSAKRSTQVRTLIGWAVGTAVFYFLVVILSFGTFGMTAFLPPAVALVITFLAPNFRVWTEKGLMWAGRILGLKNFIQTVELEKLKMMVDENPQYFYNILPYAYVLGVTDKWSRQFESIAIQPPSWYTGYGYGTFSSVYFTSMLMTSMLYTQTAMIARPNNTGSGGFGGGGGFSGGGFSGGGFGGGGGGSW